MPRLFGGLGEKGISGTGVKDAYGWGLTSWICKIRHFWDHRRDPDSSYAMAVDDRKEFEKSLNDAETIPRLSGV
jgi:hypothetical protein